MDSGLRVKTEMPSNH